MLLSELLGVLDKVWMIRLMIYDHTCALNDSTFSREKLFSMLGCFSLVVIFKYF